MKVAVVGASGNAGTALLAALRDEPEITELRGIARRRPDESAAPYDAASWHEVDIATPQIGERDDVVDLLAESLRGVDTVVHLAWLVQPNHRRDLLRRANVLGTRRVAMACRLAGVPHLVVASSVAAYSPVDNDEPRDHSSGTRGIPTSHYSVDKAAQERELDAAEDAGLSVARVRPALIFDAEAGSEVVRLFLGGLVPPGLLRPGRMPVVPLPAGVRTQVVHGTDLADAYRRIIVRRARGAFNIAGEPVLRADDLAEVLSGGRRIDVPAGAIRPLMSIAWQSRALAADPGWLDMAMTVPIMDTSKARAELDWEPHRDARSAVRELLDAMADGDGAASAPLRPRERWPHDQLPPGNVQPGSPVPPDADSHDHRVPANIDRDALALYLGNHVSGATAGSARFDRMARVYEGTPIGPELAEVAAEVGDELEFLRELIESLEIPQRTPRSTAAWLSEKAARVVTSSRPPGSGMYLVLELELMRAAVLAKLGGWQTLARLAPRLGLPPATFETLADAARRQASRLEELHSTAVGDVFPDDDGASDDGGSSDEGEDVAV